MTRFFKMLIIFILIQSMVSAQQTSEQKNALESRSPGYAQRDDRGKVGFKKTIFVKESSPKRGLNNLPSLQTVQQKDKKVQGMDGNSSISIIETGQQSFGKIEGNLFKNSNVASGVNLTPFQPTPTSTTGSWNWDGDIVVYTSAVTSDLIISDAATISTTDSVYVAFAIINNGTDDITTQFYTAFYVDGVQASWSPLSLASLSANYFDGWYNYSVGKLSAGLHTFEVVADCYNNIAETNENDNKYSRQATVSSPAPSTPANLNAVAMSSGQINLTWTASSGSPAYYRILRSTTSGYGFTPIDTLQDPLAVKYFSVFLNPNTTYYYQVIAGNSVGESSPSAEAFATTPGYSTNWTIQNRDTVSWYAIKAVDTNTVWACGYSALTNDAGKAYVARSTNRGVNWVNCSGNLASTNAALVTMEATSATEAWVGDQYGNIYYTSNGGSNWVTQSSGTANYIDAIKYLSTNTLVAIADPLKQGYPFLILRSTNNGTNWNVVARTPSSRSDVQEVCLVNSFCTVGNTLYAGTYFVDSTSGRMIESTDGGLSWQILSTEFEQDPRSIAFRNASVGIMTGSAGYWNYTVNGGASWQNMDTFVSGSIRTSQVIQGTSTYWAGGYNGVFRSTNDGASWSIESVPFENAIDALTFPSQTTGWVASGTGIIARYYSGSSSTSTSPSLTSPTYGSTNQLLTLTVSWTQVTGATKYHLQVATNSSFINPVVNDSTITTTSKQIGPLSFGAMYYWRVCAIVNGNQSEYSSPGTFTTIPAPPTSISASTVINFSTKSKASDYTAADYQIVGLPGDNTLMVNSIFTGTQNVDWQAYWDNGESSSSNYLEVFDGSKTFQFGVGRAFWIISRSNVTINRTLNSASLNSNYEVELPLNAGWNLITNPFARSIQWSKVQSDNNILSALYKFNAGSFSASTSFDPYVGYYFFNGSPNTVLYVLKVPYQSIYANVVNTESLAKNDWRVNVQLQSAGIVDKSVSFGVSRAASTGLNKFNFRKPRALASLPEIHFDRTDWDSNYPAFAADIRPSIGEVERWQLSVNGKQGSSAKLVFGGISEVPTSYAVFLVDGVHATFVDLRKDSTYEFTQPTNNTSITILVGSPEKVEKEAQSVLPVSYELSRNFPNPFNPTTNFALRIPASSYVTVIVYNVLGQAVKEIFSGKLDAGQYWMSWDGRNEIQKNVSSGMYYCRMDVAGKKPFVIKMLLLK